VDRPRIGALVRVYEGGGIRRVGDQVLTAAIGYIAAVHSDLIVDIVVDLHGNGQPITLIGAARREGTGNGWEPIEE
jgi:hypothetical protein